jgi:hypothetical protein
MSIVKYMDEDVIIKKAIRALVEELGPIDAIRFITIPKTKRMESVKRHREWQMMLDKEKFLDEVFAEKL